jgi:RNA polymerase sigma-70 factor (sigma-E family)
MHGADRRMFEEYVAARAPAMLRLAYLMEGELAAAEDLLQTAFVKLYRAWTRIDRGVGPDAYLRRILTTTHASRWRLRSATEVVVAEVPDVPGGGTEANALDRQVLRGAVGRLPRMQRAVVLLRWYEDLTEVEVARVLGVTVGTVKQHNARALRALRRAPELATEDLP